MSEKFKIEEEDERTIPLEVGEGLGDLQVNEPQRGRVSLTAGGWLVHETFK